MDPPTSTAWENIIGLAFWYSYLEWEIFWEQWCVPCKDKSLKNRYWVKRHILKSNCGILLTAQTPLYPIICVADSVVSAIKLALTSWLLHRGWSVQKTHNTFCPIQDEIESSSLRADNLSLSSMYCINLLGLMWWTPNINDSLTHLAQNCRSFHLKIYIIKGFSQPQPQAVVFL